MWGKDSRSSRNEFSQRFSTFAHFFTLFQVVLKRKAKVERISMRPFTPGLTYPNTEREEGPTWVGGAVGATTCARPGSAASQYRLVSSSEPPSLVGGDHHS